MAFPHRSAFARIRALGVGSLGVLLAACAAVPGPEAVPEPVEDPAQAWRERQARLAQLEGWTAAGRLSIRSGEEAANLSLHWRQHGQTYRIRLNAPLGQGALQLSGGPEGVVVRTSEGVWSAATPGTLLRERLGWSVPVDGLRYWILGSAAPEAPVEAVELDVAGRPVALHQSGWEIRYLRYGRYEGHALPTKVFLDNPRVSARVVLHRWTLGASPIHAAY